MKTVNIFTPVYHRFFKTKNSIESVLETMYNSDNKVHLYIGVNGIENEDMEIWLNKLGQMENVTVYNPKENFGKAKIVNIMHDKAPSSDYMISIDSDMVAHENHLYNWIDELVSVMETDINNQFGLLSTWQDEMNCHILEALPSRVKIKQHEIWYGNFGGVAGGCIILRNSDFNKIGKYTIMDVYNGDDALVMRKVNSLGRLVGVTNTIKLKHPNNLVEEAHYQEWKTHKAHGIIPTGTKGFWDK